MDIVGVARLADAPAEDAAPAAPPPFVVAPDGAAVEVWHAKQLRFGNLAPARADDRGVRVALARLAGDFLL